MRVSPKCFKTINTFLLSDTDVSTNITLLFMRCVVAVAVVLNVTLTGKYHTVTDRGLLFINVIAKKMYNFIIVFQFHYRIFINT